MGGSAGVCSANALARLADVLCGVMESSVAAIVICCCNSALHRSKQGNAAGSARTARRGVEQTAHRPMCVREAAARFGARVRPCGCVCGEWTRFPSCDSQKCVWPAFCKRVTVTRVRTCSFFISTIVPASCHDFAKLDKSTLCIPLTMMSSMIWACSTLALCRPTSSSWSTTAWTCRRWALETNHP